MTPQLRFPQFTDEWQVTRLGDVLTIGSGRDYKHLKTGDIPVYGTGGLMLYVDKYLYDGKSIGIGRKGTIDKPQFLQGKFWTVDTLFYTHRYKESVPEFLYAIFQKINWQKWNEASGVPSLSKTTIENIKITVPSEEEQEKIAEFLVAVDQRVEKIEKKLESLKKYRRGVMQKIFTQQIRFRDENGKSFPDWEEKKLGEVVHNFDSKRKPISSEKRTSGDIPYYGANGIVDYVEEHIFDGEYVLVAEDGVVDVTKYPVHIVGGKFWANNHAHVLRGKGISNIFLYYVLHNTKFARYITGSAQTKLNNQVMAKIVIRVPEISEQQKIATFLTSLDNKIKAEETRLKSAKEWKKGLLQRMFV